MGDRQILVDAGNVFGSGSVQDKFKAETALQAMNIIGYDALNVGDRELLYGLDFLREQSTHLRYPLLSANLVNNASREPQFKPHVIKEFPGLRVALLGLSAGLMQSGPKAPGLTAANPAETVKKYVEELGSRADLIVLLADVGYQGAAELARQVKGVDLIIASRDGQYIHAPGKVNGVIIAQSGNQGRHLGQLKIFLDAHKKIAKYEGNLIILDDKVADDSAMRQFIDRRQQEAEKLFGPAAAAPSAPTSARPSPQPPGSLKPQTPGGTATLITGELSYVTSGGCFRCHQEMVIKWQKTLHAKAFGALKVKSQWENPQCLRCHTTGFGHPSGFISREKTPHYMNVQCEACHGPGSHHAQNPQKGYGLVTEATCKRCHDKEQDPGFQYQLALKRGVH